MVYRNKIIERTFYGPLKEKIKDFLDEMRLSGRIYNSEAYHLTAIDRATLTENIAPDSLPREFVEKWAAKREYESTKTWANRIIVIRKLGKYMQNRGMQAYVLPIDNRSKQSLFVPHIYTDDELRRIFEQADLIPSYTNCPNRTDVASLLFRMLYGCGLRISEALNLTMKDIDHDNGVLSIKDSKFGASRLVPMSPQLTERCRVYSDKVRRLAFDTDPFFPAPDGKHYSRRGINKTFRQILHAAGIPHTKTGPRIHDLRHTFAVNCLKSWVREGKNINAMLPVLSFYLGHKGMSGTQNYLRLTADMFPEITVSLECLLGDIVTKGADKNEEI
ncbi:MAG: tyrosine-type recombinase/integrase [Firmicutes bacterium]|nr:tyrosine-type recombinase/integrase [Bacillota bacterium]